MQHKAIFLGTFDPPHLGHFRVLESFIKSGIMSKLGIDKIHVIPTSQNPNKKDSTDFNTRYKMCINAFSKLSDYVVVDDVENNFEHTYTYEIIERFNTNNDEFVKKGFYWIITVETFKEIHDGKWKQSDKLLKNKFIVMYSKNDEIDLNLFKDIKQNFRMIEIPCSVDVHSTQIREDVNKGECPFGLDEDVYEIIKSNNLYKK